jgi:hypothetical protein
MSENERDHSERDRSQVPRALRALLDLFAYLLVMSVVGLVLLWLTVALLRLLLGV